MEESLKLIAHRLLLQLKQPWVKSAHTRRQLLTTHEQPLILPVGSVLTTAHRWCCSRPSVISFHDCLPGLLKMGPESLDGSQNVHLARSVY